MIKWELVEQKAGYYFWKYTDKSEKLVYNVTSENIPPATESGYYSYRYLLSVKGITRTLTLNRIFAEL